MWKFFGPVSGRRYQLSASYAPDLKESGALTADLTVDWREYKQVTSRSLLAARFYGAWSEGNAPNFHYFGGLNTLRGYDFRTLIGQHAAFANFEFRFPLITQSGRESQATDQEPRSWHTPRRSPSRAWRPTW